MGPANALLHTAQDVGVVTGPAVGALLLAVSSDWAAFVVNAVTFAASATLISTMRTRGTPVSGQYRESVGSQLSHGMRTARMTPSAPTPKCRSQIAAICSAVSGEFPSGSA